MLPLAATFDELAVPAARFVDTIGVNTHFAYRDTPYVTRFDEVAARLEALGVKHVRDGIAAGQTTVCERERALAEHGIAFTYYTDVRLHPADLTRWATCVGPALEGFEGPNEYDIEHPATDLAWPQTLQAFTKGLYDTLKAVPTLAALPIVAPSFAHSDAFARAGDLSSYVDFANVHDYFAGHEPGTSGWEPAGYRSIAYALGEARAVSGAKPAYATETGYGTSDAAGDVSPEVAAAYVPRLLLDHFAAGIVRTDLYELVDQGRAPFGRFGLLDADLQPKPAYTALQSLIALFADTGAQTPRRLAYSLDVAPGYDVRHALFARHDGSALLALWVERPSVEPLTHLALPLPAVDVRVRVASPATLRAYAYDAAFHFVPSAARQNAATISLGDRVVVVAIEPAAGSGDR